MSAKKPNYIEACETGRRMAEDYLAEVSESRNPTSLHHVIHKAAAAPEGTLAGFAIVISQRLIKGKPVTQ